MNNKSLTDQISELQSMVDVLFKEFQVRRSNDAFTPLSKNPFLRKATKVQSLIQAPVSARVLYGVHRAYVVSTKDPFAKGRCKIFCPIVHSNIPFQNLPWAEKSEPWGSLEDQGSVMTPPAGSTVIVEFEGGDRFNPIIMGCLWNMTRGQKSMEQGYRIIEETKIWNGAPGRRAEPKNPATNPDKNHLMPPWNNESYNNKDLSPGSSGVSAESVAIPHIYGFKSPEKHFLQFVDGDFDKKQKGKRVVLQTSKGNTLFMKDDALNNSPVLFQNNMWDDFKDAYPGLGYKTKPFNNHKIELKHTGIQMQSFGGGRLIISDETQRNPSDNMWTSGWSPFGSMRSFITIESISEHKIMLSDSDMENGDRDRQNGIFAVSAVGHYFGMHDHTTGQIGGRRREIFMRSTSGHYLRMNDFTVQTSSPRRGSGTPYYSSGRSSPSARRAFVRLASGWGQYIELNDLGSQRENARQFIFIRNENKGSSSPNCPGPPWNFIRMDCVLSNKLFHLWGAGNFLISACRSATRIIYERNDLVVVRKGNKLTIVEEGVVFEKAKLGITEWTERGSIRLMVGRILQGGGLEFPLFPVVIAKERWRCPLTSHIHFDKYSKHVFASE